MTIWPVFVLKHCTSVLVKEVVGGVHVDCETFRIPVVVVPKKVLSLKVAADAVPP
jgi:hypothetical protein